MKLGTLLFATVVLERQMNNSPDQVTRTKNNRLYFAFRNKNKKCLTANRRLNSLNCTFLIFPFTQFLFVAAGNKLHVSVFIVALMRVPIKQIYFLMLLLIE
jgi:hypothetical protein